MLASSPYCMQSIPLAVLKQTLLGFNAIYFFLLHAIHTACGIETRDARSTQRNAAHCMQFIPLAVLKLMRASAVNRPIRLHAIHTACGIETLSAGLSPSGRVFDCMQSIPLAVLKPSAYKVSASAHLIACNPYRLRC